MKLASLFTGEDDQSALCIETPDGFAAVDDLARAAGLAHLEGLGDVGELYGRGPSALNDLRALSVGDGERGGRSLRPTGEAPEQDYLRRAQLPRPHHRERRYTSGEDRPLREVSQLSGRTR